MSCYELHTRGRDEDLASFGFAMFGFKQSRNWVVFTVTACWLHGATARHKLCTSYKDEDTRE